VLLDYAFIRCKGHHIKRKKWRKPPLNEDSETVFEKHANLCSLQSNLLWKYADI